MNGWLTLTAARAVYDRPLDGIEVYAPDEPDFGFSGATTFVNFGVVTVFVEGRSHGWRWFPDRPAIRPERLRP